MNGTPTELLRMLDSLVALIDATAPDPWGDPLAAFHAVTERIRVAPDRERSELVTACIAAAVEARLLKRRRDGSAPIPDPDDPGVRPGGDRAAQRNVERHAVPDAEGSRS